MNLVFFDFVLFSYIFKNHIAAHFETSPYRNYVTTIMLAKVQDNQMLDHLGETLLNHDYPYMNIH